MSNATARLHRMFKTQKSAAQISVASKTKSLTIKPQYHISIKELAKEHDLDELAKKFKQHASGSNKFRNRHNIYDFTISKLALAKRFSLIEDILESHKSFQDISHEGFSIRLISLYGKAGMFDHARNVFDELPLLKCARTVKSLNALLKAGVESKRLDEVCKCFGELPSELSISLDRVSYNTVIHALCEMGSYDDALLMLEEMKENGLSPDVITLNTLLDAFYREKGFDAGEKIWGMMEDYNVVRNTRSYNLKLQAMVNAGKFNEAVDLFGSLESEGLKPDESTFNALMNRFCDEGNIEEAKRWYAAMLESGSTPNRFTFSILVPRLCDNGDYELAFNLCKKMFNRLMVVDESLLQRVVDGLVKESMIEEAEELVELGKSNNYVQYNLALPSEE